MNRASWFMKTGLCICTGILVLLLGLLREMTVEDRPLKTALESGIVAGIFAGLLLAFALLIEKFTRGSGVADRSPTEEETRGDHTSQ
jgi:predicted benzoate:H+ symporter BenE